MLTRVEIDGFKSFEKFELALPPFVVILGQNAVGKSNLFDALRFLAQLVDSQDLHAAARNLRGEPRELFRRLPEGGEVDRIRFAVETLLNPTVRDPYGQEVKIKCTRVRYEVTIERRRIAGIERLFVIEETAEPIRRSDDLWAPKGNKPSREFRDIYFRYSTRQTPFLQTKMEEGHPTFLINQDGGQGRPRGMPGREAVATVLSSVTSAAQFQHLYALREELRSLNYLQLDPAAERQPSDLAAPDTLLPNGSNLAAVLYRIQAETASSEEPDGLIAEIRADLTSLIPGVVDLRVTRDDERREYRLELKLREGTWYSSRVISDGTLRVLALLALLHDPKRRGIICFEEPENGIYKTRLQALMHLLRDACTDPSVEDVGPDELLLQIIINTHSPVVAQALRDEVVVAQMVEVTDPGGRNPRRCTRMRPYRLSEQMEFDLGEASRAVLTLNELERLIEVAETSELAA